MRWNPIEQMQDVANKFGTEERIKRFQSGELILVERTDPRATAMVLNFERKVSVANRRFIVKESFTKSNPKVRSATLTRGSASSSASRRTCQQASWP